MGGLGALLARRYRAGKEPGANTYEDRYRGEG